MEREGGGGGGMRGGMRGGEKGAGVCNGCIERGERRSKGGREGDRLTEKGGENLDFRNHPLSQASCPIK